MLDSVILALALGLGLGLLFYEMVWRRYSDKKFDTLEEKLQSAEREVRDLRARLRLLAGRAAENEQSQTTLLDEKRALNERLDTARQEAAEFQARYSAACDRLNAEQQQLVEARELLEQVQAELQEAAQQVTLLAEYRQEMEALRLRLRAADTQNGELQGRLAVLLDQLVGERKQWLSDGRKSAALQARYQAIYSQLEKAAAGEPAQQASQEELERLKSAYEALQLRFQEVLKIAQQVLAVKKQNETLQQQLAEAQTGMAKSEEPSGNNQQVAAPVSGDRLQGIRGIGKVYARRLHAAGVDSFEKLADMTPDRLREIVGLKPWQGEPEEWIEQARTLVDDWDN